MKPNRETIRRKIQDDPDVETEAGWITILPRGAALLEIERLRAVNAELLAALGTCEHALGCLLQGLDPQEITDSFQREQRAFETAGATLNKARGAP